MWGIVYSGFVFLTISACAGAEPLLVSHEQAKSATALGGSFAPVMDPQGRYVVYVKYGSDSTPEVSAKYLGVFLRWLPSGPTRHLSRTENLGVAPLGNSGYPAVSGNRRFVVFSSEADNLENSDTNNLSDIFI